MLEFLEAIRKVLPISIMGERRVVLIDGDVGFGPSEGQINVLVKVDPPLLRSCIRWSVRPYQFVPMFLSRRI